MNISLFKPDSAKSLMDAAWLCLLAFAAMTVTSMLPDAALATITGGGGGTGIGTGGDPSPISKILCNVVGWFTGPVGKAIATIALIVIGVGALMGKVSWGVAIIVAIGIAIIFGAGMILNALGAQGPGCS